MKELDELLEEEEELYDNQEKERKTEETQCEEIEIKHCSLCGHIPDSDAPIWSMSAVVEETAASNSSSVSSTTFSDVLSKLIQEEHHRLSIVNTNFLTGILCSICKEFVRTLERLQKEVVKFKTSIIQMINKNNNIEKKYNSPTYATNIVRENLVKSKEIETCKEQKERENDKENRTSKEPSVSTTGGKKEVECLLEKRGYKYLVKWRGLPEGANSWEARFALPTQVVQVRQK